MHKIDKRTFKNTNTANKERMVSSKKTNNIYLN